MADDTAEVIQVYTHGETTAAFKNPDGSITGEAIDILTCVMDKIGRSFEVSIAPISRAGNITQGAKPTIWFPAKYHTDPEKMTNLAGPASSVSFVWHVNKNSNFDLKSPEFRKQARVTTFSGSLMADLLQENGYNYVVGSADTKRLVYMLLTGEVDAVLSVPLDQSATASVRQLINNNIETMPHHTDFTAFRFSDGLVKNEPDFINRFRAELPSCS